MPDTARPAKAISRASALTSDQGVTAGAARAVSRAGLSETTLAVCRAISRAKLESWTAAPCIARSSAAAVSSDQAITVASALARASCTSEDFHSDLANERYELFHALNDGEFNWAAPVETFTTLPHTTPGSYGANGLHRFVLRRRNIWGLSDQNVAEQVFNIYGGVQIARPPSAVIRPRIEQVYAAPRHVVYIRGEYYAEQDPDNPASYFWIWYTTDGSDPPDPEISGPDTDEAMRSASGTARVLNFLASGSASNGQVFKAYVATATGPRNQVGAVKSKASELVTLIVNTQPPVAPVHKGIRHLRSERTR